MGTLIGWDKEAEKWRSTGFMNPNDSLSHRIGSEMLMAAPDGNINAN